MQDKIQEVSQAVKEALCNERPLSVLEISGFDGQYGVLISSCLESVQSEGGSANPARVDRVDLSDGLLPAERDAYDNVYGSDYLFHTDEMEKYDMMIVFHLFENMVDVEAGALLEMLLKRTKKQVLVITPEYPYDLSSENDLAHVRAYHPIFFLGLDFSHEMLTTAEGRVQAYSFFPKVDYEPLPCDMYIGSNAEPHTGSHAEPRTVPHAEKAKLRIAYILPNHTLTGGMKALLQQIKELTRNGHTVDVYYRSDTAERAIPEWSHLTDDDVSSQTVIPTGALYPNHVKGADVIVIAWMQQILEFKDSEIPVVLWEQGSSFLFGDYGELAFSESLEHLYMHKIYRAPVHILAVSEAIQTILKGVFNRESQLFPNGIDANFYFPLEKKNNEVPVVLLAGTPASKFKGFDFALTALEAARRVGIPFRVWWASPADFTLRNSSISVEKFINPTQDKLAELFRSADVLLSTSVYESFSLPPLEAMASGTAVIAADNGGINTYAIPGQNCLLCEQGDLESVFFALQHLLLNPAARDALAVAGRETALEYSFEKIVPRLEQCLHNIL